MDKNKEIQELKSTIEKIQERNRRVEADKAWETSWTRRVFIAISTYVLVSILMISIGIENPFRNAVIPALAYFISTTSLGFIKEWWLERRKS